jgi:oxygen-independent coproporphyrinogen-3 oxidase
LIPGLYIHVPFCKSKCPYCGFYSVTDLSLIPRWISALAREISLYQGTFQAFDTLYLGGGTPSVLSPAEIERILEAVLQSFSLLPGAEITIEVNPGDVAREEAEALKAIGFNRISLGAQSFHEDALDFLGRRHSVRAALEAFETLRAAGFHNIGMDLIYGFEALPPWAWKATLDRAIGLRPSHLSCYQLSVEKGTPFCGLNSQGRIRRQTETRLRGLFLFTSRRLSECGYIHYEVSNFARDATSFSRHNRKYWSHAPYLGLGPSAHSFQGAVRWWNVRSVEAYCRALEGGQAPVEDREVLDQGQMKLESLGLGLRTIDGVPLSCLPNEAASAHVLRRLSDAGLIEIRNRRARPTLEGLAVADGLPLAMMPPDRAQCG